MKTREVIIKEKLYKTLKAQKQFINVENGRRFWLANDCPPPPADSSEVWILTIKTKNNNRVLDTTMRVETLINGMEFDPKTNYYKQFKPIN